jgi:hypothetical protein
MISELRNGLQRQTVVGSEVNHTEMLREVAAMVFGDSFYVAILSIILTHTQTQDNTRAQSPGVDWIQLAPYLALADTSMNVQVREGTPKMGPLFKNTRIFNILCCEAY